MKRLVSIILPTLNEKENIVPLIRAIEKAVAAPREIIVVDDNSPDGTSRVVASFIKKEKNKIVRLETRQSDHGLTKSIRRGIALARGDIVVWLDCDFSMPPRVIPELIRKIDEGYDIAMGSRYIAGGRAKSESARDSWAGIVLSNILNYSMRFLAGDAVHDYTSGFVAVKKNVLQTIPLSGDYGEYFIDFIVRAYRKGYKIHEVPFISASRRAGESKTGKHVGAFIWRGRKYLWTVIKLMLNI